MSAQGAWGTNLLPKKDHIPGIPHQSSDLGTDSCQATMAMTYAWRYHSYWDKVVVGRFHRNRGILKDKADHIFFEFRNIPLN